MFGLDAWAAAPAVHRSLAHLGSDPGFLGELTAGDQLDHLGALRGMPKGAWRDLSERLELDPRVQIRRLSRGNRQKVGVVAVFMGHEPLLVMDEPTTGLDPIMQREFLALVAEAQAEGRTVFLSSHNLTEVERACDRVGIIRGGELVRSGPVRELLGGHARSVHLVIDDGQDLRALEMPGVRVVSRRGRDAQLLVHGDVNPLIRRLGTLDIRDITITTPDIEEVFLRLYEGPTERASVDPVRDRHPLEVTR